MSAPVDTSAEAVERAARWVTTCITPAGDDPAAILRALAAERAALRAALTGIASQKTSSEFSRNDRRYVNFESGHKDVVQIARAALKGNTP